MPTSKFDPIQFIDRVMSDGKRRSERQIRKTLLAAYTEQAEQDVQAWLAARNTRVDQGLRLDERGPHTNKLDRWGSPTRYQYWWVEQDREKIDPSDPFDRLPTQEEAYRLSGERAEPYEAAEKAKEAKWAGVTEE